MSLGKILAITASLLLMFIGAANLWKNSNNKSAIESIASPYKKESPPSFVSDSHSWQEPIEIVLDKEVVEPEIKQAVIVQEVKPPIKIVDPPPVLKEDFPEDNRIEELFSVSGKKLPFIETITYKSRVAWQKGRPAWLSDYASHYNTSRHFIARSLNGKPDYFKQEVAEGNKFNVFRQDFPLKFHLAVDTTRCKMWFYALSGPDEDKILLKTYKVSLGRPDASKESLSLTPLGKYQLGSRIAIYKPKVMGHYKGQKTEMIQVFGTRWIPFETAIGATTAPPKGFGLHGVPWIKNQNGELEEDLSSLGKNESDGCVRMATDEIEEVFAVVITQPTFIELVKDISHSELFRK